MDYDVSITVLGHVLVEKECLMFTDLDQKRIILVHEFRITIIKDDLYIQQLQPVAGIACY